jgi:hypothetical protein
MRLVGEQVAYGEQPIADGRETVVNGHVHDWRWFNNYYE